MGRSHTTWVGGGGIDMKTLEGMGVPELRRKFIEVFKCPSASNNGAWLRKKLAAPPDARVGAGRHHLPRKRDQTANIWTVGSIKHMTRAEKDIKNIDQSGAPILSEIPGQASDGNFTGARTNSAGSGQVMLSDSTQPVDAASARARSVRTRRSSQRAREARSMIEAGEVGTEADGWDSRRVARRTAATRSPRHGMGPPGDEHGLDAHHEITLHDLDRLHGYHAGGSYVEDTHGPAIARNNTFHMGTNTAGVDRRAFLQERSRTFNGSYGPHVPYSAAPSVHYSHEPPAPHTTHWGTDPGAYQLPQQQPQTVGSLEIAPPCAGLPSRAGPGAPPLESGRGGGRDGRAMEQLMAGDDEPPTMFEKSACGWDCYVEDDDPVLYRPPASLAHFPDDGSCLL
ncbi:unnamed protein product [Pedinophyceae sp. YPF-701]|nr:unnamed protein product [Pedinophyceae sp. YPF-701]